MPTTNVYTTSVTKLEPIQAPDLAQTLAAKFKPSVDLALGTLVAEYADDPGVYGAYDHAGVNGLNVLKGITQYRVITDAAGLITNLGGPLVSQLLSSPIYYSGYFAASDLVAGEVDDAIAAGYMRLVQGTATTGIVALGL